MEATFTIQRMMFGRPLTSWQLFCILSNGQLNMNKVTKELQLLNMRGLTDKRKMKDFFANILRRFTFVFPLIPSLA
ncbi:hypothetical protein B4168_0265 [Anoxybacillus flavithermus]|nr:hypothetical protein GT20_1649 [Parageobacillus thermoglucosidasius TNO-09.020]KYD18296.1 hypothetical protein B4168_0265 [Anoxybacillus flavithermus]